MTLNKKRYFLVSALITMLFTAGCNDEIEPSAVITSLSEEYGKRGSTVTVSGSNFLSSAIVYFGNVAATPTSINPTTIVVQFLTTPWQAMISLLCKGVSIEGPSYHVYTPAKNLFFTETNNSNLLKIDLINTPKERKLLFDREKGMPPGPVGLALSDDGYLYITTNQYFNISKMAKDGSGDVHLLYDSNDGVLDPSTIAIDNENNMLYWANNLSGKIMKASTNGTDLPSALLFDGKPAYLASYGLKLDISNREFYLTVSINQKRQYGWLGHTRSII